jgi:hypothetical protein
MIVLVAAAAVSSRRMIQGWQIVVCICCHSCPSVNANGELLYYYHTAVIFHSVEHFPLLVA